MKLLCSLKPLVIAILLFPLYLIALQPVRAQADLPIVDFDWNADGDILAVAVYPYSIFFLNEIGEISFEHRFMERSAIRALAWHPVDSELLVLIDYVGRVFGVRFTGSTVEPAFYIDTEEEFGTDIDWNLDGTLLGIRGQKGMGAGEDRAIQVWRNWSTPERISRLTIPARVITGFAWSATEPDGLFVIGQGNYVSSYLGKWNVLTATETWAITEPHHGLQDIAVSPDGTMVAVTLDSFSSPMIRVFSAASGSIMTSLPTEMPTSEIAWSPQRLLAVEFPSSVYLWDSVTSNWVESISAPEYVRSIEWSPTGKLMGMSERNILVMNDSPIISLTSEEEIRLSCFVAFSYETESGIQSTDTRCP